MSINKKLLLLIIIFPSTVGLLAVLGVLAPFVALSLGMIPLCRGIYEMLTTKEI